MNVKLLVALILIATIGIAIDIFYTLNLPLRLQGQSIVFELVPGSSVKQVANELRKQGLMERTFYFVVMARLSGNSQEIKAGEYQINKGTTSLQLLDQFVKGKTILYSLTFPEGWTYKQISTAIAAHPNLKHTIDLSNTQELMQILSIDSTSLEGWFYPDTYHFSKGTADIDILRQAYRIMEQHLAREWQERGANLPFSSPYEALILASIVEKETAVPDERKLIAAVFVSRLRKGMRLQTDPTVIYGMGERYKGNIRKTDLQRDTPYNTYIHRGLPPTPIAMPGGDSVHAVLHPANIDALYFVAKGSGEHHFSNSYEEHRAAVIKYQLGGNARRYKGSP